MAKFFTCEPTDITYNSNGTIHCSAWVEIEYVDSSNLIATMDEYLAFDAEIFGIVEGAMILAFISGHIAGKVLRIMGKLG